MHKCPLKKLIIAIFINEGTGVGWVGGGGDSGVGYT